MQPEHKRERITDGHLSTDGIGATSISDYIAYLTKSPTAFAHGVAESILNGDMDFPAAVWSIRFMSTHDRNGDAKISVLTSLRDDFEEIRTVGDALEKLRGGEIPEPLVERWILSGGLSKGQPLAIWEGYPNLRSRLVEGYSSELRGISREDKKEALGETRSNLRLEREELPPIPEDNEIDLSAFGEYQTKDGKKIDLTLLYKDPRDRQGENRGWLTHRIDATIDGKQVGYLKVSYIPAADFVKECPTVWHFLSIHDGVCFGIDPGDLNGIWRYYSKWGRTPQEKFLPSEEKRDADLATIASDYLHKVEEFMDDFVDRPFVDYIDIEEGYPEGEIQVALIESAAKWLGSRGLRLYRTKLNQEFVWDYFRTSEEHPIRTENGLRDGRERIYLDYSES